MRYKRTQIAEGIGFSCIIDEKFKTTSIAVRFITPLDSDTSAANALGMAALTTTTRAYPSPAMLNERLSSLYGAGLTSFARKRGDLQILGVSASWICSRYAIDGEDLSGEMLRIVRGCLFEPDAENGRFSEEPFAITKTELLDRIESELNNKRGYALSKASETAFRGEPAELPFYGSKESALAVTAESAFAAYENILRTAQIEITIVSPEEIPGAEEDFRRELLSAQRQPVPVTFRSKSPLKPQPVTVSEEMDVNQCKMVLALKSPSDDVYAMRMLSVILGELPVSKLFLTVREKLSLCYYCASAYSSTKGTLFIDSGVQRSNIERAKEEILHQLSLIREGEISDEEMESAMLSREDILSSVGDTPSSWSSWYFERLCDGGICEPKDVLLDYKAVTKARIVHAAQSLELDSVWLMLDKEEG
ncbi:MAG: insulinase family protein [Ruminococcus sp.]|nr:insulinase family protein [Ruminococcus sp.]